jgi:hypothetical protein
LGKKSNKVHTKNSDILILKLTLGFVSLLISGFWFSQNYLYILITVLYFLGYFIYCTYIFIKDVKDMWKNEPFSAFTNLLAVLFLGLPILIISVTNQNILSDSIKLFYTIAIGIGINSVIDGVIKFIEPEFENNSANKLLTKKAAFMKILFNSIYISEYAAFVFLEQIQLSFFEPLKQNDWMYKIFETLYRWSNWFKIFFLCMVFFLIIMSIATSTMNLIRKEFKNEMNKQTYIGKSKFKYRINHNVRTKKYNSRK